jgi:hypothetical protein
MPPVRMAGAADVVFGVFSPGIFFARRSDRVATGARVAARVQLNLSAGARHCRAGGRGAWLGCTP